MGLLPDTWNCVLRMRLECRERFPRHQLQRKPLVSNPGVTHVPWCLSGSLTCGGQEKRSQHSRCMRNPQFYVSGKRPMGRQGLTRCVYYLVAAIVSAPVESDDIESVKKMKWFYQSCLDQGMLFYILCHARLEGVTNITFSLIDWDGTLVIWDPFY